MKKTTLLLLFTIVFWHAIEAQYTKLFDFDSLNGSPVNDLIYVGTFLYGMTVTGGINDSGTVFKIKPDGTGYVKLLDFAGPSNGKWPEGALFSDGTFVYGMTIRGGVNNSGIVFKIKLDGTGYMKLLDFNGTNGDSPQGSFVSDGTFLYGTTQYGGTGACMSGCGVIFRIQPDGTGYSKLFDFVGGTDGKYPIGSLFYDGVFLYGMTIGGGSNNHGTIFKIKPDGTGYFKLLDFTGTLNGSNPFGNNLISDGTFLYGMTHSGGIGAGTIFKIKPDGTGYFKLLDFAGIANGADPEGSLFSDGTFLYGLTGSGGTSNKGVLFKIKPDGTGYSKLLDFAGVTNGSYPWGSLISDGSFLYGMTSLGGANDKGTIFKYSLAPSGISESNKRIGFNIFPNPGNGNMQLDYSLNATDKGDITIYDIAGKLIYKYELDASANQIIISHNKGFNNGIYFYRIEVNGKIVISDKLIIIK